MTPLTIHPKPLPDELCSSWLIRFAAGQGLSLGQFRRLVSPRIQINKEDSDLALGAHQIQPIADATSTDTELVRATLLRCDPAFERGGLELESWIMPIGTDRRTNRRIGYQYCPICLSTGTPYIRKSWRLSLFAACTDHQCLLVDTCFRCGEPIHAYSSGLAGMSDLVVAQHGLSPLTRCGKCGWDLRKTQSADAPDELISQQKNHEVAIGNWRTRGWDPFDYFWVLRQGTAAFARELAHVPFQVATVGERTEVLLRVRWLLEDERWRYIQSVCSIPRSVVAQRKPPVSELLKEDSIETSGT